MNEWLAASTYGAKALQEALRFLSKMRFSAVHGDFAEGEHVRIMVEPWNDVDGTFSVLIACSFRGPGELDWEQLALWIASANGGVKQRRIVPSLGSRGEVWIHGLRPQEYSILAGSKTKLLVLNRIPAGDVPNVPRAAASGMGLPHIHVHESVDGSMQVTVRSVAGAVEIAFETRRAAFGGGNVSFAVIEAENNEVLHTGDLDLAAMPGDPMTWEGVARLNIDWSKPCRLAYHLTGYEPSLAERHPQPPDEETVERSAFASLDALKQAWYSVLTQAQVRDSWEHPPHGQPWHFDRPAGLCGEVQKNRQCYAERLWHNRLWHAMVHPEIRGFFRACRETALNGGPTAHSSIEEWLARSRGPLRAILRFCGQERGKQLTPVFRAHLLCARAVLKRTRSRELPIVPEKTLRSIQQQTSLPFGLIRDLAAEIGGGEMRTATQSQSVAALLVDTKTEAAFALDLVLESLSPGSGHLYPAPALALVFCDPHYREAETAARKYILETLGLDAQQRDVRWSWRRRLTDLPCEVSHSSTSAAIGLLWRLLWERPSCMAKEEVLATGHRTVLTRQECESIAPSVGLQKTRQTGTPVALTELKNLAGAAISAELSADGRLRKVGDLHEKIGAALFEKSVPRIHTLVLAEEQRKDVKGWLADLSRDDSDRDVQILFARTLDDAISKLAVDAQTRWGAIPDYAPTFARHTELVGREGLKEQIGTFFAEPTGGYLLILAGPGFGKSALMAETMRTCPYPTAFHFVERGQGDRDRPGVLLASLTAQLRRLFTLPVLPEEQAKSRSGAFSAVLARVSRLLAPTQRAVICVDGLDEACDPSESYQGTRIEDVFTASVPRRIKILVTSRHMPKQGFFADPSICQLLKLGPLDATNRRDICQYLWRQNQSRKLRLTPTFIDHLADATQGYFAAAVLYLRERPHLKSDLRAWEKDPLRIPAGLDGWLEREWERLFASRREQRTNRRSAGKSRERHVEPPWIKGLLGLMAVAREPLSPDQVHAFLDCAYGTGRAHIAQVLVKDCFLRDLRRHVSSVWTAIDGVIEPQEEPARSCIPRCFFHSRFREFVLEKLDQVERQNCHRFLARVSDDWKRHTNAARDYALRYRIFHWAACGEWEKVSQVFSDSEFILDRAARLGFSEVHRDAQEIARLQDLPPEWREAASCWEEFLRWRIERLRTMPAIYLQEVCNEFLSAVPAHIQRLLAVTCCRHKRAVHVTVRKLFGPPSLAPDGHRAAVTGIAFSPDARCIASASQDGTVKIWDAVNGHLRADCFGHGDYVTWVAFSPLGKHVASSSDDGTVKVWEAMTGELVANGCGHQGPVTHVAFSPDGCRIASASDDLTVKTWDAASGSLLSDCVGHRRRVNWVEFSPDRQESLLASAGSDGTVRFWDADTGQQRAPSWGHEDSVIRLAFSPDGKRLASACKDGNVRIWDVRSGRPHVICRGHEGWVLDIGFSLDGHYLASGGQDGTMRLWDAESGNLLADCAKHSSEIDSLSFSADGRLIATGGADGTVRIWEAASCRPATECVGHRERVSRVAFGKDREVSILASGSWDGGVRIWNPASGQLRADCVGRRDPVVGIAISPDGNHVASTRPAGRITIFRSIDGQGSVDCPAPTQPSGTLVFSPCGVYLAGANASGTIRVWDVTTGRRVADGPQHSDRVTSLAFSPDELRLASASVDGTIHIFDTQSGRLQITCRGHELAVTSIAFSFDGTRLVSAGDDKTVRVFATESGEMLACCTGHNEGVRTVVCSPDGRHFASGGWDADVKIWSLWGGLVANCRGHVQCVNHLAFSPDGHYLASAGHNGTVKIWDSESGRAQASLSDQQAEVTFLAFCPNGHLVSGSSDRTVRLWDLAATSRRKSRCISVLFFQYEPIAARVIDNDSLRLTVADRTGQVFGYEVRNE
jgi:WD40 repeat protein